MEALSNLNYQNKVVKQQRSEVMRVQPSEYAQKWDWAAPFRQIAQHLSQGHDSRRLTSKKTKKKKKKRVRILTNYGDDTEDPDFEETIYTMEHYK